MAVLFTSALSGTKANLVGEYTINYQDVANNRTNVTATLSIVSTGYYLSGTSTIFFNGSQYNPYINISQWGRQVVATQTYNINHNSDGTGSISISGSCNVANGSFQASGSGGAGLPTIPRASQPSLVTFPNTTDNIFIGDRITIHFNRKSTSFTHKIQLLFDGYNPYLVENPIGGDNWVWDTSINATEIYKKMPTVNRKQGTIRLYTYNGGTLIGSKDVNFIANIKDANPIFTNFEYEIIDDKSISLTGNNKTAIKSFSNVKAIVSNINKAQAQKEATITKYKFVCGNKQIEVPYNDDTEMLLEQIDNVTMNVYAIDSRGNSTMVGKTFDNFIEYENIRITELNANRLNGVDTQTNLSYKGNYWGKSFGEASNTIKSVKYEYKEIDGTEWILGETDITPKIGTVNKTASGTEITVEDSLAFPLNSIKIDGKTVQDGTPTPDNPVEIKNVKGYKNLWELRPSQTHFGVTYTNNDGRNFSLKGTATGEATFSNFVPLSNFKDGEKYTLTCNKIQEGLQFRVEEYTEDNKWIRSYGTLKSDNLTLTISKSTGYYVRLAIIVIKNTTINLSNIEIQMIEGSEEKPYVPFGSNYLKLSSTNGADTNSIFLNLKDNELAENDFVKIANNYGTIYKTKETLELTGDENWKSSQNNRFYCQDFSTNIKFSSKILSTHFKSSTTWVDNSIFVSSSGNVGITIPTIQTVEEFKQWLKDQKSNGTPVIVQYDLATPYTIDLGIQDNLDTYEGTTVISLEDELNPNMEINYVAKGEEEIGLGEFDFSGLIKGDLEALGFTLNKSFNIKVTISDELSTFSLETILNTGTPNLAIAKSGVSIGSKYDESVGGKIQGIYEVGDLFISTKNENPSIRFGGTWKQIKDVFLLACGDKYKAGAKGGSDKHTLTKAEIPHLGSGVKHGGNVIAGGSGWADDWLGGGNTPQSFSIMPPYLAVYVWVRTA